MGDSRKRMTHVFAEWVSGAKFSTTHLALLAFAGLATVQAQAQEFVPGEVLIKLKGSSKAVSSQAFIGKAVSEKSMTLKGSFSGLNLHHFALKPGADVKKTVQDLQNDPSVEFAEPNWIVYKQSEGIEGQAMSYDEASAAAASSSSSTPGSEQTGAPIQLADAWNQESSNANIPVVAVIDTGISSTHDVFTQTGAVWTNAGENPTANGIDDEGNGYIDDIHGWNFVSNNNNPNDDNGHGTHCSGIILGTTQDIMVTPRSAARIRIMPLKFLDSNGSGSTSAAVQAIYYAVNNGAKVLSNSWGGSGYSDSLLQAMAYAYDHHVIFVAAAGNNSSNNDSSPTYPANYNVPNVISTAATVDNDTFASFSNYGASTVHMGSPGNSILSTFPNNTYARESGTSMATPFISGLAALILRESPSMYGYQVKSLILNSSVGIASLVGKTTTQARLNVYNGIVAAKSATVSGTQPAYSTSSMRDPSSASSGMAAAGCGLVKSMMNNDGDGGFGDGGHPQSNMMFFGLLIVLSSPVLISVLLRQRSGKYQRRHPRYQINSEVRVKFGDRELVGQVSTISLGGVQLNTEEWLEKGGTVAMSIRSPDGKDEIQVEGKVVWSEESKRYGVAFSDANDSALSMIGRWTQSLLKV